MTGTRNHPILTEMLELGCSQSQVAAAFQVYMDLIDTFLFCDVRHELNKRLNLIYLTARKTRSSQLEVFIPVSSKDKLSMEDILGLQTQLSHTTINIVATTGDSTSVIYRLGEGLVLPESPGTTALRKERSRHRMKLAMELNRRKMKIHNEARPGSHVASSQVTSNHVTSSHVTGQSCDQPFK